VPAVRSLLAAAGLAALVLTGCGGDDGPTTAPSDCTPVTGGKTTLVASNLRWSTECLRAPVGDLTFTVRNEDDGVKHDLEVYGGTMERAKTPLFSGPASETLEVTLPAPGRYSFVCTIHAQMEGDLFAEPPA
jgi:plastocyanin